MSSSNGDRRLWSCPWTSDHDRLLTFNSRWSYRRHVLLVHGHNVVPRQDAGGIWHDDFEAVFGEQLSRLRQMFNRGRNRTRRRRQPQCQVSDMSPLPTAELSTNVAPPAAKSVHTDPPGRESPSPPLTTLPTQPTGRIFACQSDPVLASVNTPQNDFSAAQMDFDAILDTDNPLLNISGGDFDIFECGDDVFNPLLDLFDSVGAEFRDSNNNETARDTRARSTSATTMPNLTPVASVAPTMVSESSVETLAVNVVPATVVSSHSLASASNFSDCGTAGPENQISGGLADKTVCDTPLGFCPRRAAEILSNYSCADPAASINTLVNKAILTMGISHPTFLQHQVLEAVAVGIANAWRQDAINELFLLAPSVDDPPSCVTLALGDIQCRLIRRTESNGNAE